jgi:hypothetical protein
MLPGDTLRPVAFGMIAGVVAAVLVSRLLAGVLFGASATDPIGLAGADPATVLRT